ncbi:DUF3040 domain-containing protein [Pseudonocardia sp. RS11V-5]|uniref:DUF3040 domain-containing protein n=1 Tax=Pseudonocardia terrae TaxID=2905831 RepID=UPI001E5A0024|nr:DUF3040 domain-containing protein [Pseudonocardia terrae]MCE3556412.1 DUF3040 domain-containing protein [Pseudonocardia terrae]
MLSNRERHLLDEVESRLRSDDPAFVARLGDGQQRLPAKRHCAESRFRHSWPVVVLAVLAIGLLVLGVAGSAVLVAALAAAVGWLSTVHIEAEEEGKR